MTILKSTKETLWEVLVSMPLTISSIIFYVLILGAILLISYLISRYLWKVASWVYCLLIYWMIGKINNLLYQKTKMSRFYQIDDHVFTHLYKLDIARKEKNNMQIKKAYIKIKKILVSILSILVICIIIGGFQSENTGLFKIINAPTIQYKKLERKMCKKNGIEIRKKPVKQEEAQMEPEEEPETVTFYRLNEAGVKGANIREMPSKENSSPIVATVSGDVLLESMGEEAFDERDIAWVKVKTEDGVVGFISSRLIIENTN